MLVPFFEAEKGDSNVKKLPKFMDTEENSNQKGY